MITALFSVLLLASDTAAATPAPDATASVETRSAEAPKEERKICKREIVSGGLHRTRRVCLTAAEWRARARGEGIEDLGVVTTK